MLILPIKKKWYDRILSGEKKEEYREVKAYYRSRFGKIFAMKENSNVPCSTDEHEILFRNGYSSASPSFSAMCTLDIRTGKEEWGAEPGKEYYVLSIRKIL